ncbi:MAG: DUF342 domain-containing protein [Lachnospiraceae bacterium]
MDISKLLSDDNLGVDDIINSINGLFNNGEDLYSDVSGDSEKNFVFDMQRLIDEGYAEPQIHEIEQGCNQGLAVDVYARSCYNWVQMHELRLGLLEELDVSKYANPLFSGKQMHEIRLGLLQKVDVMQYARLIMSATDMRKVRLALFEEMYNEVPEGYAVTITDDNDNCTIRVSSDCMSAYLQIDGDENISTYQIKNILKKYDITYGLIDKAIESIAGGARGEEVRVAMGSCVKNGDDGWYEKFFESNVPQGPKLLADGRVDYTCIVVANKVNAGENLVKYHPATEGKDGVTVNGAIIRATKGKDLPKLTGIGYRYDQKNETYIAVEAGCVQFDEIAGVITVSSIYTIQGDVNRYNGRVKYDGTVLVNGDVTDMAMIEAGGDVIIEGFVGAAVIKAGRNVVLKRGMNAGGQGYITSNGRVMGNFFEGATVSARDGIEGNYFLNCHLETEGKVVTKGGKARILGGEIIAAHAVESAIIGSNGATRLLINVGDSAWITGKITPLKQALDKVEEELSQLIEGRDKMEGLLGEEVLQNPLYTRTCMAIDMKDNQKRMLVCEIERLTEVKNKAMNAYINVRDSIQEGVWVAINGVMREIQECQKRIILTRDKIK